MGNRYKSKSKYRRNISNIEYLVNMLMKKGKKNKSYKIVQNTLRILKTKRVLNYTSPILMLNNGISILKPALDLKSVKRGATTVYAPVPISQKRQRFKAIKWLIEGAKEREGTKSKGRKLEEKLANEIIDLMHFKGGALEKKLNFHRQGLKGAPHIYFAW